jgi:hypothetical protein
LHFRYPVVRMIDSIDAQLRDWLEALVDGSNISFSRPSDEAEKLTLFVYLFDIERPAAVPSGRTPPTQLRLGYIVTACGPDPIAAHALLGKIIAEAGTQSQYSLEFGEPASAAWSALNLAARASFVLRATASVPSDKRPAPPVREAVLSALPLASVAGTITAADGTPLPGAVVTIDELGRTATAQADGRFALDGVSNAIDLSLRARAKGREVEVKRPAHSTGDLHIVIDVAAGAPSTT